ncbi:MoxR family ATPase [Paenibacillus sp. N1-5-1-14]|uniref:AAA family ATPase n=1 Tax=Paenibacillus radicibacter TaxID=2972488 RepID=UPI0021597B1D|nr:MoxR family ATPase [Paenibacillus radicibacter]MCR8643032.1 MoxR family ATPase [Paenibacillus radicibacter]
MRVPILLYDEPAKILERIAQQLEKVLIGKKDVIEKALIAMLTGGHLLLEDAPGVGKTLLARALAQSMGCDLKRLQCTPDLMPSDITGVSVLNPLTHEFEFRQGPLFTSFILADELNRTTPKTQAALLEAMEERKVSVDGVTYALPQPFHLIATQNSLDYEGTYPLPEAQLDRFMMRLSIGYPAIQDEVRMLERVREQRAIEEWKPVVLPEEWLLLEREAAAIHVDQSIKVYIVGLTSSTRNHPFLRSGASPRASYALMRAAQARALMQGRSYVIPDDVKMLSIDVLSHRLALTPQAEMAGHDVLHILHEILKQVVTPFMSHVSSR